MRTAEKYELGDETPAACAKGREGEGGMLEPN